MAAAGMLSPKDVLRKTREFLSALVPVRYSRDFCSVNWFGTIYTFTPAQAAAVRLLIEAWEQDTPTMRQETLLEESRSTGSHLADLFRDHPAWGTMIQPGDKKGTYRIADPE